MNGRAPTAHALPAGLLLLALGVPSGLAAYAADAADVPPQAACEAPQATAADSSKSPDTPPEMSPEAKLLPDTPAAPGSFKCDPPYGPYATQDELAIYGGKHMNPTAQPPVDLGLGLYDRGAYAPRPTFLGAKNTIQDHFMAYGDVRVAAADNDNGVPAANGKTYQSRVATRLNLDLDLNLTATERIHAFMRPFDQNGSFTRYEIDGGVKDKFVHEFNAKLTTLFFEGDVGSMVAGL